MRRTRVVEALNSAQARDALLVKGWVRTRRDAKDLSFLELNDGSCLKNLQVIVDTATPAAATLEAITTGAAVEVEGALVASPGKNQQWEVHAQALRLLGAADPDAFPLQKKRHTDEFLRSIAHLRPRTNKYGALFRIRSETAFAVHQFFRQRGFHHLHAPIITGSDCEVPARCFASPPCPLRHRPAVPNGPTRPTTFSARRPTSPSPANWRPSCSPAPWATCTPSGRRSGRKIPTPRGTPPNSG